MKVAIALATYNPNLIYLEEQLDSLRQQSFQDWVCYVSDESTSLEAQAGLKSLLDADPRFILLAGRGERKGVIYNFERALSAIPLDFEYVCFCDQDDVWRQDKIASLVEFLKLNPECSLVHSDLRLIDERNQVLAGSCWQREGRAVEGLELSDLILRNVVTGCALMFRRRLLADALPFPKNLRAEYLHDHWLALLARARGPLGQINDVLIDYRQHANNVVGAQKTGLNTIGKKVRNLFSLRERGLRAIASRRRVAQDLLSRLLATGQTSFAAEISPIIASEPIFYLKYFFRSMGRKFEFSWSLQLLAGAVFIKIGNK